MRRVAIIGSGPSGFYAAEALLLAKRGIRVDMLEHLPAPFGLVRYGVAPDHLKLKEVINIYKKIAALPGYRFFGNVSVGRDVSVDDLKQRYDAIIFASGAQSERRLQVPGEELRGVHSARDFVAWYNGHPDFSDLSFDFGQEVAVVVGQGNVAVDVARILAKTRDELCATDISSAALEQLAASKVREIHVIGRRGPAQAKFVEKEIRELGALQNCDLVINPLDLNLNDVSAAELEARGNTAALRTMTVLKDLAQRSGSGSGRKIVLHFLLSPLEILGESRIESLRFSKNGLQGNPFEQTVFDSGVRSTLRCGLLFKSIGYVSVPIPGVPFDRARGVIPNFRGRVTDADGAPIAGLYVSGWAKRGANGIIGTNRACSLETTACVLEDLDSLAKRAGGDEDLPSLLNERRIDYVDFARWLRIDLSEIRRGEMAGKPREKFVRTAEMLSV